MKTCLMLLLLIGAAFAYPYVTTDTEIINGSDYLASQQQDDGGFGGHSATCWSVMAISSMGEDPETWVKNSNNPVDYLKSNSDDLGFESFPEAAYARTILALVYSGEDPTLVGGNLVEKLKEKQAENGRFGSTTNGNIWAAIAMTSVGDKQSAQLAVDWLKQNVEPDGCWGITEGMSDSNDCAAATQLLKAAGDSSDYLTNALIGLAAYQQADGGFVEYHGVSRGSDSCSDSWAIQGIQSAGQDPTSWLNNGNSPLDHLLPLQNEDGSFDWTDTLTNNRLMNTYYAIPALLGKYHPFAKLLPDFEVSSVSIHPNTEDTVFVNISIDNSGDVGAVGVEIRLDTGESTTSNLPVGTTVVSIPLTVSAGDHSTTATVDPNNYFEESNEGNNLAPKDFTIISVGLFVTQDFQATTVLESTRIVPSDSSAFDILSSATEVQYTDWGWGVVIDGIAGVVAPGWPDATWSNYVNGIYASVGATDYIPKEGDMLSFDLVIAPWPAPPFLTYPQQFKYGYGGSTNPVYVVSDLAIAEEVRQRLEDDGVEVYLRTPAEITGTEKEDTLVLIGNLSHEILLDIQTNHQPSMPAYLSSIHDSIDGTDYDDSYSAIAAMDNPYSTDAESTVWAFMGVTEGAATDAARYFLTNTDSVKSSRAIFRRPDITISASPSDPNPTQGQNVDFTVTLTNNGEVELPGTVNFYTDGSLSSSQPTTAGVGTTALTFSSSFSAGTRSLLFEFDGTDFDTGDNSHSFSISVSSPPSNGGGPSYGGATFISTAPSKKKVEEEPEEEQEPEPEPESQPWPEPEQEPEPEQQPAAPTGFAVIATGASTIVSAIASKITSIFAKLFSIFG